METRQIKFKAKRLDNGEWVEGDLFKAKDSFTHVVGTYIGYHVCNKRGIIRDVKGVEVDPSTVCQYTGLKDMKGREIWEHDYITDFPHCGEVIFVNGGFAMHSDVGDLPIERFIDKLKDSPLGTYGQCLVTNQGSKFDRNEGEK